MAEQNAEGWRKASYSGTGGGDCAEVGQLAQGVAVRDTKNRGGSTLGFSVPAWHDFLTRLQS